MAVLRDRHGRAVTGVIVEVQRQKKRRKLLAWPVYAAALRAKFDCPAVLLVVAPDPAIATWARRPIELGHPGLRAAVITLARTRLGELSASEIAAIDTLSDPQILTGLIASLGRARSAASVRAALARALNH